MKVEMERKSDIKYFNDLSNLDNICFKRNDRWYFMVRSLQNDAISVINSRGSIDHYYSNIYEFKKDFDLALEREIHSFDTYDEMLEFFIKQI